MPPQTGNPQNQRCDSMFIENIVFINELPIGAVNLLTENYFTVMSIIAALYIGLLAFMYPKIIDVKKEIQQKYFYLYEDFEKERGVKYYFPIISVCLILTLFFIFVSILLNKTIAIYENIVIAGFIVIYNWYIIKKLNIYLFHEKELLKNQLIDYSLDMGDRKIAEKIHKVYNEIQKRILFLMKDGGVVNYDEISSYISYIKTGFENYIEYLIKNPGIKNPKRDGGRGMTEFTGGDENKIPVYASADPNNNYYEIPLERLQFINQKAIDANEIDISHMIIFITYEMLHKVLKQLLPYKYKF